NTVLRDCIGYLRSLDFDLVIVETAGIGQSDSEIVDLVDFPMYVMTSDYGAASQLEKIDMLDFAELVVLNKYDRRGAEDALRDVRKQWKRNRVAFQVPDEDVPVYPTIASQFNDPGVSWMFANLCRLLRQKGQTQNRGQSAISPDAPGQNRGQSAISSDSDNAASHATGKLHSDPGFGSGFDSPRCNFQPDIDTSLKEPRATVLIPGSRVRYLAEIAEQGRAINRRIETEAETASRAQHYWEVLRELGDPLLPEPLALYDSNALQAAPGSDPDRTLHTLRQR